MEFKDVADWLRFVCESPWEGVAVVIDEDFSLQERLCVDDMLIVDGMTLVEVRRKLQGTSVEEQFWHQTLPFVNVDCLSDDLVDYFIAQGIALDMLAHLPLSDKYLWILAEQVEEALITLGKRHYLSDAYTTEEFVVLLEKASKNYWLWSSLLSVKSNNTSKRKSLVKRLFLLTNFDDLKENVIEEIAEGILSRTTRTEVIRKYYVSKKPRFLRGIAQNPRTPRDILIELSNIGSIKFAKQIRQMALDTMNAKEPE